MSLEGFTCLFQMTNGTNHLLTCLLAFSLAILDSCLFDPFFSPGWVVFFLLIQRNSLQILNISPLSIKCCRYLLKGPMSQSFKASAFMSGSRNSSLPGGCRDILTYFYPETLHCSLLYVSLSSTSTDVCICYGTGVWVTVSYENSQMSPQWY